MSRGGGTLEGGPKQTAQLWGAGWGGGGRKMCKALEEEQKTGVAQGHGQGAGHEWPSSLLGRCGWGPGRTSVPQHPHL